MPGPAWIPTLLGQELAGLLCSFEPVLQDALVEAPAATPLNIVITGMLGYGRVLIRPCCPTPWRKGAAM